MIIDGKTLAAHLRQGLKKRADRFARERPPSLLVILTQETAVTRSYIAIKEKVAAEVGIAFTKFELDPLGTTEQAVRKIMHAGEHHDGVVVQLPVAHGIHESTLKHIMPITHDPDVYGETAWAQYREGRLPILPPVVGAISDILFRNGLSVAGKNVVVVGDGWLVGKPAAVWVERMGAKKLTVITRESNNTVVPLREAEVIITGAGHPGLITPDMVRDGVIVLDAGTSEVSGKIAGDVDPAVAEKAHLFTPVPGGIGPIAVAKLFENLLTLKELREGIDRRLEG